MVKKARTIPAGDGFRLSEDAIIWECVAKGWTPAQIRDGKLPLRGEGEIAERIGVLRTTGQIDPPCGYALPSHLLHVEGVQPHRVHPGWLARRETDE